jgi:hypothetical protein
MSEVREDGLQMPIADFGFDLEKPKETMKECLLCGKKVKNDESWGCDKCDPPPSGWGEGGW